MTGMMLISANILDPFQTLQSFSKWDKGMVINREHETSYTTQYQEAFLMNVENKYCAKHCRLPVTESNNKTINIVSFYAMASRFGKASDVSSDLSSDNED